MNIRNLVLPTIVLSPFFYVYVGEKIMFYHFSLIPISNILAIPPIGQNYPQIEPYNLSKTWICPQMPITISNPLFNHFFLISLDHLKFFKNDPTKNLAQRKDKLIPTKT